VHPWAIELPEMDFGRTLRKRWNATIFPPTSRRGAPSRPQQEANRAKEPANRKLRH